MKWDNKSPKQKETTLDDLWRDLIHLAGKCEYCGSVKSLNAHHIFSRSNRQVRWEPSNGVLLCPEHHVFGNLSFHKAPIEMLEWIRAKRGETWYTLLRGLANGKLSAREAKEKYYTLLMEALLCQS